jgi:hypothetical protein
LTGLPFLFSPLALIATKPYGHTITDAVFLVPTIFVWNAA